MNKRIKPDISVYLPQALGAELSEHELFIKYQDELSQAQLDKDWQSQFCNEINYSKDDLPWNHLRASQFDIPPEYKTLVCCDPVIMQMTHRGAYLWGQEAINFTKEESIRIVAQINQQLMGEDECFYLLSNNQWLYAKKEKVELNQSSFEKYIGKDLFGFSYQGEDSVYWNKLATEIQMLIKQMMDYQDLPAVAPEMIVNVFFWGDTDDYLSNKVNNSNTSKLHLMTNDELIQKFCLDSNIHSSDLDTGLSDDKLLEVNRLIMVDSNNQLSSDLLTGVFALYDTQRSGSLKIITQDKLFEFSNSRTLWKKMLKLFRKLGK